MASHPVGALTTAPGAVVHRRPAASTVAIVAAVALGVGAPLLVAAAVLANNGWSPTLDVQMIELRVRDVFTGDPPLVGLPGRLEADGYLGSHPGPLGFYLLAGPYWLFGGSAWALEAATAVLGVAVVAGWSAIGWRAGGRTGVLVAAALGALIIHVFGPVALLHPWNPYGPLLPWGLALAATWCVLRGDVWLATVAVGAASWCAQWHVSYVLSGALVALVAVVSAWRRQPRVALVAIGVGVVAWLPPLIDQLVRRPGNAWILFDHFTTSDEPPVGLADGARLTAANLDVWSLVTGDVVSGGGASPWRGAALLAAWLVVTALAWRQLPRGARAADALVAGVVAIGWVSTARILGPAWPYLTLSGWTAAVAMSALTVVGVAHLTRRLPSSGAVAPAVAVVAVALTAVNLVNFAGGAVFDPGLSPLVTDVAAPVCERLRAALGDPLPTVLVVHRDSVTFGSLTFGVFADLERDGCPATLEPKYATMAGEHRISPAETPGWQVVVASGSAVAEWEHRTDVVMLSSSVPLAPDLVARREELRQRVRAELEAIGRADLVPVVVDNPIGLGLLHDLPPAVAADVAELIGLSGQAIVVLVAR